MEKINVKIKLVIFGVSSESLVIYISNNLLPSENIVEKMPLDEQVEKLFLKTLGFNLENNYIEQLYTVSDNKDQITIVYYILLSLEKNNLAQNKNWLRFEEIKKEIGDYKIISYATQRLRWKIEYTNVVYSLLPQEFTLSDLQKTYEGILGQLLDKRNFRKKILALHFLQATGKKRIGPARPAQMYSFKKREPTIIKIFS